jgi:hypothetical protein
MLAAPRYWNGSEENNVFPRRSEMCMLIRNQSTIWGCHHWRDLSQAAAIYFLNGANNIDGNRSRAE